MAKPDYVLIFLIFFFVVFGFLMLISASAPFAINKFNDSYYYAKKQFWHGLLPGLFLFWIFSRLPYGFFKKYSNWIFGGSILLLLLVFIPGLGASYGKARSWVDISGFFSFQPSEIVKLAVIIFFAAWFEYKILTHRLNSFDTFVRFFILTGLISLLVILQPDIGTAAILVIIAFLIYFIAGAPRIFVGAASAAAGLGFFILVKIAPYRAARLTAFFNPSLDKEGIGYHINQALLAIGSGRFWGAGLGHSRQKFYYLPEASADSIFAIIGEELGFLFSALFIAALLVFFIRGLKIANSSPDLFGKFLAVGIVGWIGIQAFVNIGAMLSLLPLTGLPLPFISYGGTALATTLAASGILVNISKRR